MGINVANPMVPSQTVLLQLIRCFSTILKESKSTKKTVLFPPSQDNVAQSEIPAQNM